MPAKRKPSKKLESVVLGGGCFWCTEAVYSHTKGVISIAAGYAGGTTENPNYEKVSGGNTGHAETVKIDFDPEIISLEKILRIFFLTHNPTTRNRQGNDVGSQYRSIILYDTEEQKEIAARIIRELNAEKIYSDPIVTEISPLKNFYPAETYHQKYFAKNPEQAYCQTIISPKIAKLRQKFGEYFK